MAIFTFILFFLYPRFSLSQVDPILFQATLTLIVLTIFSFGFSGLYYYQVVSGSTINSKKQRAYLQRADIFFVLGLLFAISEPALILFTVGVTIVATIATVLWILYTFFIVHNYRETSKR